MFHIFSFLTEIFETWISSTNPCKTCSVFNDRGVLIGGTLTVIPTEDNLVLNSHTSKSFGCGLQAYLAAAHSHSAYNGRPTNETLLTNYLH